MADRRYRVRVYTPGSTSLSTANVDFTLSENRLTEAPTVLGSIVRPREGRTEAQPWFFDVADIGSSFTAQLADSSGRLDLLNRIIVAQRNTDGGTYTNIGVGRISDVFLNPDVASYRVMVEDERVLERSQLIFNSSNTTHLYPPGPHADWGIFKAANKGSFVALQTASNPKIRKIAFLMDHLPWTDDAAGAIANDLKPNPAFSTVGNFTHCRLRYGETDYQITAFGSVGSSDPYGFNGPTGGWVDELYKMGPANPVNCWIAAASSAFTLDNTYSSAYLHMMSAPPSAALPLHIGGKDGLHPMQVAKNIYDGDYSSSPPKIRYSTAAFKTGTTGLLTIPMPLCHFRVTGPAVMSEWLEDYCYAPFMVIPFTDSSGRINPRSVRFPNSTAAITFTFTGANLTEPPTWVHPSREMVTVLQVEHLYNTAIAGSDVGRNVPPLDRLPRGGNDYIAATPKVFEVTHDRVTNLGRHTALMRAHGVNTGSLSGVGPGWYLPNAWEGSVERYTNHIKRDIFDRFGDGPIMGTLASLATGEAVSPGDFVKLTLGIFPNPATGARSGTRVVQIMERDYTPIGPRFTYLDAGPSLQPVAAPTLTLANSTLDPKHSVIATVGTVPADGGVDIQVAHNSTRPAASSTLWQPWDTVTTTGTHRIGRRPSGTIIWARARAGKPNRLRSTYTNSTATITSSAITAPSAFTGSSVTAGTVLGTWTVGDSRYKTVIHGDTSTSATFTTANQMTVVAENTKRYKWDNLAVGTKYLLGVRHRDDYGGYSARSAAAVTTSTGTPPTAPAMLGIEILRGIRV